MDEQTVDAIVDALARYEVQTRWPSLKHDRIEENVGLTRSDVGVVRTARIAAEAIAGIVAVQPTDAETRRDMWRRAGIEAAAQHVRRNVERYVVYGSNVGSIERHVEAMLTEIMPTAAPAPVSQVAVVRKALARDAVASGWPGLRADLVETNISMMENDARIVRHAEIAVRIAGSVRQEVDPELAVQENRDIMEFQRGVETASRYFVTLSAKEWSPRTIGWGLKHIADDIRQRVQPS